jgi:hypothetical protein
MGIGAGFPFSHVVSFAYRIAKDWVVAVKLTLYISTHFFLVCISGCAHIAGRQNKDSPTLIYLALSAILLALSYAIISSATIAHHNFKQQACFLRGQQIHYLMHRI